MGLFWGKSVFREEQQVVHLPLQETRPKNRCEHLQEVRMSLVGSTQPVNRLSARITIIA